VKVGAGVGSVNLSGGCLGPRVFAGELFTGCNYYLEGAGAQQQRVLKAITNAIEDRAPGDTHVKTTQIGAGLGSAPRDVLVVEWSIATAYVVCFAPGKDLFLSARVHFVPGCIARVLSLLPWYEAEPNLFGIDDINMVARCVTLTVEEQLDDLQLAYLSSGFGRQD
jgi:hypothetical protein